MLYGREEKFEKEKKKEEIQIAVLSVGRQGRTSGPSGGEKEAGPVPVNRRQVTGTGTYSGDGKGWRMLKKKR